jgi:hypothetical protein
MGRLGEPAGAGFGDGHLVFEAHAEFAVDADRSAPSKTSYGASAQSCRPSQDRAKTDFANAGLPNEISPSRIPPLFDGTQTYGWRTKALGVLRLSDRASFQKPQAR